MIFLDTSVVSAVLRRRRRGPVEERLSARVQALLASDALVGLPGIVLQELLSGIAERPQLQRVLQAVRESFPVLLASEEDHITAAELVNTALRRGVALSTPDALIAAQALALGAKLFSTDEDFERLTKFTPLEVVQ